MAFKGKAPGGGAGDMSRRTEWLPPAMLLSPREVQQARRMGRAGSEPDTIAAKLGKPLDEIEKALVQMRMPRPESTHGTLNITLAAHRSVLAERRGDEPLRHTFDRTLDELLRLREQADDGPPSVGRTLRRRHRRSLTAPLLPGL